MSWYVVPVVEHEGSFVPGDSDGRPFIGAFTAHCHDPKWAPTSCLLLVDDDVKPQPGWVELTKEDACKHVEVTYGTASRDLVEVTEVSKALRSSVDVL